MDLIGAMYINHYFLKTVQLFKFVIIANEENISFPVGYGTQPGNPSNSVNTQISYPFYFVPNHIHHGYLDRCKLAPSVVWGGALAAAILGHF